MLSLLRSKSEIKAVLDVKDEIISENNGRFLWEISKTQSKCSRCSDVTEGYETMRNVSVSIAELTEFVFGKRKITGLEEVEVLSKICINEAV